jgi:shikimate kinase
LGDGPPERVVLVGFMGSGKSTVGRVLARKLGWGFVDMDERIEQRRGLRIAEIFRQDGEAAFRREELAVAGELRAAARSVIATGGGAFAEAATREALRAGAAYTVWLAADFEALARRVPTDGSRPLAADREIMRRLLEQREPFYRSADLVVDATDAPEAIAGRILAAAFPDTDAER